MCGDDHDFFQNNDSIPTTNSGEQAFMIQDFNQYAKKNAVSGHVILNQCSSLLSRKNFEINGSSKHKFFLQKMHSTTLRLPFQGKYKYYKLFTN